MSSSREPSQQPSGHQQDHLADEPTTPADELPTRDQAPLPIPPDPASTFTDSLDPDAWKAMLNAALPRPMRPTAEPTAEEPPTAPLPVPAVTPPRPPQPRRRAGLPVGVAIALLAVGIGAAFALAHNASSPGSRSRNATAAVPTSTIPASATTAAGGASGASVQVVRQGVAQLPAQPDGDHKATYAALLRNSRSDQIAVGVHATITLTGSSGTALTTTDETLDALLPGQTGAVAGDADAAGVTGLRVQVLVTRWVPAASQGLSSGGLQVSGIHTGMVADKLTTTATVHSTLTRGLSKVKVVAVWYDRAGRLLGGSDDSVDTLAAGASAPVTVDTSTVPPGVAVARTEVYAVPDDLFPTSD